MGESNPALTCTCLIGHNMGIGSLPMQKKIQKKTNFSHAMPLSCHFSFVLDLCGACRANQLAIAAASFCCVSLPWRALCALLPRLRAALTGHLPHCRQADWLGSLTTTRRLVHTATHVSCGWVYRPHLRLPPPAPPTTTTASTAPTVTAPTLPHHHHTLQPPYGAAVPHTCYLSLPTTLQDVLLVGSACPFLPHAFRTYLPVKTPSTTCAVLVWTRCHPQPFGSAFGWLRRTFTPPTPPPLRARSFVHSLHFPTAARGATYNHHAATTTPSARASCNPPPHLPRRHGRNYHYRALGALVARLRPLPNAAFYTFPSHYLPHHHHHTAPRPHATFFSTTVHCLPHTRITLPFVAGLVVARTLLPGSFAVGFGHTFTT